MEMINGTLEEAPRYFFTGRIFDVAHLIIGFESFPTNARSEVLDIIETLGQQRPQLEIHNPTEMLESFFESGIVPWEEHRRITRTAAYLNWLQVGRSYVRIDHMPNLPHTNISTLPLVDLSLGKPEQLELAPC